MQPRYSSRVCACLLGALVAVGCTASAPQQITIEPPEIERKEFIDQVGIQWMEFPDPERASFNGATVTVARGTTLQISATECQRPSLFLAGESASLGRVHNRIVYNERNVDEIRDLSLYFPPLLPEGIYEFTTTCSWTPDTANEIDLSVRVVVVDKPDLIETPDEAHLPSLFCIEQNCDVIVTPE